MFPRTLRVFSATSAI